MTGSALVALFFNDHGMHFTKNHQRTSRKVDRMPEGHTVLRVGVPSLLWIQSLLKNLKRTGRS